MRVKAQGAVLASSIAFQFGMIVALAQTDWFARTLLMAALTVLVTASVLLGILLERCGLT